ncbi:MAG: helix-turn-helix domain-containing protein [Deltaproteobacteria bacterium]|nr:helix-turn-helix domain-containing protein [Deltaproteobacteria bacterium]
MTEKKSNVKKTKDRYITVQHVADTLSCTERHVYYLIQDGALKAIKIGQRAIRISENSFDKFVKSNELDPEEYFAPEPDFPEPPQNKIARSTWMIK